MSLPLVDIDSRIDVHLSMYKRWWYGKEMVNIIRRYSIGQYRPYTTEIHHLKYQCFKKHLVPGELWRPDPSLKLFCIYWIKLKQPRVFLFISEYIQYIIGFSNVHYRELQKNKFFLFLISSCRSSSE